MSLSDIIKNEMLEGNPQRADSVFTQTGEDGSIHLMPDFSILITDKDNTSVQNLFCSDIELHRLIINNNQLKKQKFVDIFANTDFQDIVYGDSDILHIMGQQSIPFFYIEPKVQDSAEMDIHCLYFFYNGDVIIQDKQTLEKKHIKNNEVTKHLINYFTNGNSGILKAYLNKLTFDENASFIEKGGRLAIDKRQRKFWQHLKSKVLY